MFGVIVSGAVPVLDLFVSTDTGDHHTTWPVKAVMGAGALICGTLDLVFDLSNRARAHSLMKRRYFELLANLVEGQVDLTHAMACLNRFSADEEPAYHALIAGSWNAAQEMVYGDRAMKYDVPAWQMFLKNVFRFESFKYGIVKAI
jgi:hypothetical protein